MLPDLCKESSKSRTNPWGTEFCTILLPDIYEAFSMSVGGGAAEQETAPPACLSIENFHEVLGLRCKLLRQADRPDARNLK